MTDFKYKSQFIKDSAIKKYFKDKKKQSTPEAIEQVDHGVRQILLGTLDALGHHKRATGAEVIHGNKGLFQRGLTK